MKLVGIAMWAAGLALFMIATFIYDPSVSPRASAYLPYEARESPYLPDRVVNADRQQRQMLLAMAGLTLFLAGVLVNGLGVLAGNERVKPSAEPNPLPRTKSPPSSRGTSAADAELMAQHGIRPGDDGAQV